MDYRKLKSGSDVRGVAVGDEAVLTADVAKTLGMAFARYVAGKTGQAGGKDQHRFGTGQPRVRPRAAGGGCRGH